MKHTYIIKIDWVELEGKEFRDLLRETVEDYSTITKETQSYLYARLEEATALELHSFLSEVEAYEGEIPQVIEEQ